MHVPPWHLWGGSESLDLVSGGVVTTPVTGHQLVKIAYGRPETWSWLFLAKMVEGPATPGKIEVFFNLTTGVGRATGQIYGQPINLPTQAFEKYVFQWGGGAAPLNSIKWSTEAFGPQRDDTVSPSPENRITEIPAQDIQLEIVANLQTVAAGDRAKIIVSAFFAPKNHIRPEWFERVGHFPGNEDHGK